ncbi:MULTISPECIES: hypothetical protein [Streptomyces]|nr:MULTISPECIES: hypothetical protein [Streptomyces]MCZ4102503.1 hypothetical protein [Streptomyces sp. H39-C1]
MAPTATATPLPITIATRLLAKDEVEIIGDLDTLVETVMCSCNAGDDNPY